MNVASLLKNKFVVLIAIAVAIVLVLSNVSFGDDDLPIDSESNLSVDIREEDGTGYYTSPDITIEPPPLLHGSTPMTAYNIDAGIIKPQADYGIDLMLDLTIGVESGVTPPEGTQMKCTVSVSGVSPIVGSNGAPIQLGHLVPGHPLQTPVVVISNPVYVGVPFTVNFNEATGTDIDGSNGPGTLKGYLLDDSVLTIVITVVDAQSNGDYYTGSATAEVTITVSGGGTLNIQITDLDGFVTEEVP